MSSHPPHPPYGPLYNSHLPAASTSTSNYGMQQYQNQPQAFDSYWQGQRSFNSMPVSQNISGHAHPANGQAPVQPSFSARVPSTPYGGYPGTLPSSSGPAQFFPSAPNSTYATSPDVPRPQMKLNNTSYETAANHPSNPQSFPTMPLVEMEEAEAGKEASAEREDGELSSGEQVKSSDDFHGKPMELYDPSTPGLPISQNSALQNGNKQNPFDPLDQAGTPVSRPQPDPVEAQKLANDSSLSVRAPRDQALAIIRELYSYGIGFQEIVGEGFEVALLQELYAEIGLPIHASVEQKSQHNEGKGSSQAPSTEPSSKENFQGPSIDVPNNSGTKQASPGPKDVAHISPQSNTNDDIDPATSKTAAPLTNTRLSSVIKGATKAPAAKPLDRKDYIARLMAAKIGRPPASSEAASETSHAPHQTKIHPPGPENFQPDSEESPSTTGKITNSTDPSAAFIQAPNETPDAEVKRKAQTELARQKMEALMTQKKSQSQILQGAKSAPFKENSIQPASLGVELVNSAAASGSVESQKPANTSIPTDARQTSYFSPVSLKPAFNIPGLFTVAQETTTDPQAEVSEPPKISTSLSTAEDNDTIDTGLGPRKRHKAADFMNSTSTAILQRSLSRGEDAGVIIDISDDETEHPGDDLGPPLVSKQPTPSAPATTRRGIQDSVNISPSNSNTPSKTQEPQQLKQKESEIEMMNRKILELEQRIKARQAASRVQSPRVPANTASRSTPPVQQPSSVVIPRNEETNTGEPLLTDKEKQDNSLATAKAEPAQTATDEEQLNVKDGSDIYGLIKGNNVAHLHTDSDVYQNGHHAELESNTLSNRVDQEKAKLRDELSSLGADIARLTEELHSAKSDTERLTEKLHLAELGIHHRQSDLQTKMYREKFLQEQLLDLQRRATNPQESPQIPYSGEDSQGGHEGDSANSEAASEPRDGIHPRMSLNDGVGPSLKSPTTSEIQAHDEEHVNEDDRDALEGPMDTEITSTTRNEAVYFSNDIDQSSNGELEEDNMDISGSDVDEGEVIEAQPDPILPQDDTMDTSDDEEFYEPPMHIGQVQQSESHMSGAQGETVEPEPAASPLPIHSINQIDEGMTEETNAAVVQPEDDVERAIDNGLMQADGKDDDDYEPPEPESSAIKDTDPLTHTVAPDDSANDGLTSMLAQDVQQPTLKNVAEGEHFIPYESPLKQFASYRFHPDFRNEVPGGYRSLTYSHNIQPEIPLCQYELGGGVCNDKSCTSQHFQKMVLSDHIILGAMGKQEGSTPEQKDSYIQGLRSLIVDLRDRQVKDLDAIAQAIAQYRSKFLNDTSWVLPL